MAAKLKIDKAAAKTRPVPIRMDAEMHKTLLVMGREENENCSVADLVRYAIAHLPRYEKYRRLAKRELARG